MGSAVWNRDSPPNQPDHIFAERPIELRTMASWGLLRGVDASVAASTRCTVAARQPPFNSACSAALVQESAFLTLTTRGVAYRLGSCSCSGQQAAAGEGHM